MANPSSRLSCRALPSTMDPQPSRTRSVDTTNHEAVEAALRARPSALLYAEAIANPLLRVNDVATLARLASENGAALAVDATFATPLLFRPAALGATMVIHSLTKYINGH